MDEAAVFLGGLADGEGVVGEGDAAGFSNFSAEFAAGVGLGVQGLGDGGGGALVRQDEEFDGVLGGLSCDLQGVAELEDAGGFCGLRVAEDVAGIAGGGGERAGFEEACRPEPFIDTETVRHKRSVRQREAVECGREAE